MKKDRTILDLRTSVVGIMLSLSHKSLMLILNCKSIGGKVRGGSPGKKKKTTK